MPSRVFGWGTSVRKRGEDANLDRRLRLRAGGDPQEADWPRPEPLHNSTVFECVDFREKPHLERVFGI